MCNFKISFSYFLILYSVSQLFWQIAIAKRKCFMSPFKVREHRSRLQLVGEIPYNRGNEEIVGSRGTYGERQQNRENVGECKGIESKLSNRQSGEGERYTLQQKTKQFPMRASSY